MGASSRSRLVVGCIVVVSHQRPGLRQTQGFPAPQQDARRSRVTSRPMQAAAAWPLAVPGRRPGKTRCKVVWMWDMGASVAACGEDGEKEPQGHSVLSRLGDREK